MLGNAIFPASEAVPCVVENRLPWQSLPMIGPSCSRSPVASRYRGFRSAALGRSWRWLKGSAPASWPSRCSAMSEPSAALACATANAGLTDSWNPSRDRAARSGFPPLQRAQIVELACLEPIAQGLHITHWTSKDLALQAVERGIVPTISDRTVRTTLNRVDLQPHRTRYWRTSHIDAQFKERAAKVLWCYANAERLARRGICVVCADERPNFQVLERHPSRHAVPGSIAQREFDYTRHGTVTSCSS